MIKDDLDNECIFISRDHSQIAGVVSFDDKDFQEYEAIEWNDNEGRFAVIHRLAVRPAYQGLGVAKELIQFVHDSCRKQQYSSIRLDVHSDNKQAVQFYINLGYEVRGEVWFTGGTQPYYCMEKRVSREQNEYK
ncbi:TDP-fucosamine acetyltransferase [compost metagenome]